MDKVLLRKQFFPFCQKRNVKTKGSESYEADESKLRFFFFTIKIDLGANSVFIERQVNRNKFGAEIWSAK